MGCRGGTMFKSSRYFAPALLVAGVLSATPACAQYTYGQRGGYYRDVERRAYDIGYRDGIRQGENDARRGRAFAYTRHDEYRDADNGYHRGEGDLEFYRRSFRQGFQ